LGIDITLTKNHEGRNAPAKSLRPRFEGHVFNWGIKGIVCPGRKVIKVTGNSLCPWKKAVILVSLMVKKAESPKVQIAATIEN